MANEEKIRILLVDDDEEDFILTKETLWEIKNQRYSIEWVPSYEEALSKIQNDCYDLFLIDYNLGAKTGIDLITEISEKNIKVPIIMLTGQNNREIDILAMKRGASDYLVKGKFNSEVLERAIRYAIEKKVTENQILYLAYYDQVTNLPNRVFFKEQLNYALAQAMRYNRLLAVLFLDLDNFKLVNDSLGHHIGDILLKEVAKRLYTCVRKSDIIARNNLETLIDTVARLGGDEFSISLTEITTFEDASLVAGRIIESLNEPFMIENNEVFTGVSIGIAIYPIDSDNADTLLKYADSAMYFAKKQGKNNYQYYQKSMNDNVLDKVSMIKKIRKALEQNEFLLHYQPKMNLRSGELIGFEALIRWDQGERGLISPMEFIPFAEQHHLLFFITDWVIHRVCRQLCEWEQAKLRLLPVSINLPVNQFKKLNFVHYITQIISSYNLHPKLFELEVTESIFMSDMEITNLKLNELQSLGFHISIDDFGTGSSSLNRLKEVPCNVLKIDKSFIKHDNETSPDAIIIKSIITMGHGLKMDVLAEGVETVYQFNFLKRNNCDFIQGYILSKPLSKEKIPDILKQEENGKGLGIQLIKRIDESHPGI